MTITRILLICLFLFSMMIGASGEIQFEDVSRLAGITRKGESWGNAWGDFDGDGYLDLWATNHKHKPSLYRNNGDGTFTNIIDQVWDAYPFADTHGVAWGDFDNDGDQDLIVLCGSGGGINRANQTHYNHFYVNENGKLVERAAEFGIDMPLLRGRAPLWFDWNIDGLLDLVVTGKTRTDQSGSLVTSTLFAQDPCCFKNVNEQSGFNIVFDASLAQLADVTGDGTMELFVHGSNFPGYIYDISYSPFRELTEIYNYPKTYNVLDSFFADFNGDLKTDVFLACGTYKSFIDTTYAVTEQDHKEPIQSGQEPYPYNIKAYVITNKGEKGLSFKSEGKIRFEVHSNWASALRHLVIGKNAYNVYAFDGGFIPTNRERNVSSFTFELDPTDPRVVGMKERPIDEKWRTYIGYDPESKTWTLLYHTMPAIDTNWSGFEAHVSSKNPIVDLEHINFTTFDLLYQPKSALYLAKHSNKFQKIQFLDALDVRSVAAGDFDNDMDIDIYAVRSNSAANLPNQLYENQGDGSFVQVIGAGGAEANTEGKGMSVTMADYDIDGYLDLFVTNGRGIYPYNNGPDQLYKNIGNGNNWLQIDLEGTVSNRDGIGARLFATTPDGKTQLRENNGGIHWAQQDQRRIHFGLGQNKKVSELVIYWQSGIIQKLHDIDANQLLHIVEEGETKLRIGDVNMDGQLDILDLLIIVAHFGENPPSNSRLDTNKDGKVDLDDVLYVIKGIQEYQHQAAPSYANKSLSKIGSKKVTVSSLSEIEIALLQSFLENIEEMSGYNTQKTLTIRFLKELLKDYKVPLKTRLYANYPNPFNPETWIPYQLDRDSEVTVRIYNTKGTLIRTLFTGHQVSGYYLSRHKAAYWDGRNENGEIVSSGVYFYELETPSFKKTKKLVLIK